MLITEIDKEFIRKEEFINLGGKNTLIIEYYRNFGNKKDFKSIQKSMQSKDRHYIFFSSTKQKVNNEAHFQSVYAKRNSQLFRDKQIFHRFWYF